MAGTRQKKTADSGRKGTERLHLDRDLLVLAERRHEMSGNRVVMAAREDGFVVAWVAPWQKTLQDYRVFKDEQGASAYFKQQKRQKAPTSSALVRDFQVTACYRWQDKHLSDSLGGAKLSKEKLERIVQKISDEFNLVAPDFRFAKSRSENPSSYYWSETHEVVMRHRDHYIQIHEMAHVIDHKINRNEWSAHGPSFMRTLIHLAEKYLHEDKTDLEKKAKKAGLLVAPESALPDLFKPEWPKP